MTTNNHFFIDLFEERLRQFTGAPYVVLTDSCTNAIFLSLKYYGSDTNEVKIPAQTYISVPQAIRHAGYTPVFASVWWEGYYELIGTPIIDAAVGFTRDMYVGGVVCISFQQKKALPLGRGGAILLNNEHDYNVLKRMSWDGRDASKSVEDDLPNIIDGYHMHMIPEVAAQGVLALNQYRGDKIGSYQDYPNISGVFR